MKKGLLKYGIVLATAVLLILGTLVFSVIFGKTDSRPNQTQPASDSTEARPDPTRSPEPSTTLTDPEEPTGMTEEPTEEPSFAPPASVSTQSEEEVIVLPHYDVVDASAMAFIGESRTLFLGSASAGGVKGSGVLEDHLIFAKYGSTLTDAESIQNTINAANARRKKAVFWFGINDVQLSENRDSAEEFVNNYQALIREYLNINRNSEIFILSVITTSVDDARHYEGQEDNIALYNEALRELCRKKGYKYVDISSVYKGEPDLLSDNVHFTDSFYKRLIVFMENRIGFVREAKY